MLRLIRQYAALVVVVLLVSLIVVGTGGTQSDPSTDSEAYNYDRWEMVGNIMANSTVMLQEDFLAEAALMQEAAQTFADDPTLDTLTALQDAWRATTYAWYRADIVGYDQSALWRNQISKTPMNVEFVENFIADNDTIDSEFIGAIGSTSKGLPVIEYLIFPEDGDNQAVLDSLTTGDRAEQRMQYLLSSVDQVNIVGQEYMEGWLDLRDYYLDNRDDPEQLELIAEMELRDLTNKMIDTIENIVTMRLGQPLGKTTGGDPRPDLVDFSRSDFALPIITAQMEGLQVIFNGITTEGDGIGYDDHIAFVEAQFDGAPLEDAINAQIELTLADIAALDSPLTDLVIDDYEAVNIIYEDVRTLVRLVKADMTSQLAIELIFSDNDGD